jgi:hypothetical protein
MKSYVYELKCRSKSVPVSPILPGDVSCTTALLSLCLSFCIPPLSLSLRLSDICLTISLSLLLSHSVCPFLFVSRAVSLSVSPLPVSPNYPPLCLALSLKFSTPVPLHPFHSAYLSFCLSLLFSHSISPLQCSNVFSAYVFPSVYHPCMSLVLCLHVCLSCFVVSPPPALSFLKPFFTLCFFPALCLNLCIYALCLSFCSPPPSPLHTNVFPF